MKLKNYFRTKGAQEKFQVKKTITVQVQRNGMTDKMSGQAQAQATDATTLETATSAELTVSKCGNRFVADAFPDAAFLEFVMEDNNVMDMVHTFVAPAGRGKGLAGIITKAAFQNCKELSYKVRPSCTYIAGRFLDLHPEYRNLCVQ